MQKIAHKPNSYPTSVPCRHKKSLSAAADGRQGTVPNSLRLPCFARLPHPPRRILLSPRRRAAKKLWSTPIRKWGNSLPIRRGGPGQALDKGVRGISTRKGAEKLWSTSIRRGLPSAGSRTGGNLMKKQMEASVKKEVLFYIPSLGILNLGF